MTDLQDRIRGLVQTKDSMNMVNKLTNELVKQAAVTLKPQKMDDSQGFTSNALLHAPDLLFSLIAAGQQAGGRGGAGLHQSIRLGQV